MLTTKRLNNRPPHSPRPPHITFPRLARVDGSANFAFGPPPTSPASHAAGPGPGPSALASLTGPIEVRLAAEHPAHATLEVLVRPLSNVPATEAKALAANVRAVLGPSVVVEQNPRTLVQIVAQVLVAPRRSVGHGGSGSGSGNGNGEMAVIAAVVNASALALLNAGSVPMRGVVCAVAVGRRRGGGLVVDPDEGDGALDAEGCFAYMFTRDVGGAVHAKCVWTNWRAVGAGTEEPFEEGVEVLGKAREVGERGAREVYNAVYASVERMYAHGGREVVPAVAAVVRGDVKMEEEEEEEEEMEDDDDEEEEEEEMGHASAERLSRYY